MSNGVLIDLDKPRKLRFGLNAVCDLEDLVGKPISEMFPTKKEEQEKMRFTTIRAIIWAGLRHEDEAITPSIAGALIDDYCEKDGNDLASVMAIVMDAFKRSGLAGGMESKNDKKKK